MDRVQVLVSGAGPVGVTAANRLAQAGIDVLLLEAQADCPQDMRASTFHPPTLEMMEQLGFRQTLEDQGLKAPIYQYRNRATGEVLAFDLGEIGDLTHGRRHVERCPANGWVTRIVIEAQDEFGRALEAVGTRLSGIIINRHSFIDSNGLIAWTINGHVGHGEDQDMWPVHDWAAFRRGARQV